MRARYSIDIPGSKEGGTGNVPLFLLVSVIPTASCELRDDRGQRTVSALQTAPFRFRLLFERETYLVKQKTRNEKRNKKSRLGKKQLVFDLVLKPTLRYRKFSIFVRTLFV